MLTLKTNFLHMKKLLLVVALLISVIANAQVLSVREQSKLVNELLAERLNNILPLLMERTGIDMWVIMSREYNEDPVLKTMLPAEWLSARRRTILVFYNNPQKNLYEKLKGEFHFDTLSVGMSDDLETAIAEGSTMVRIGTAIFGQRTKVRPDVRSVA